jgi:hypothetical protein
MEQKTNARENGDIRSSSEFHLGLQQSLTTKNHFYRNRQTEFSNNTIDDPGFEGREAKYSFIVLFQARGFAPSYFISHDFRKE